MSDESIDDLILNKSYEELIYEKDDILKLSNVYKEKLAKKVNYKIIKKHINNK